MTDKQQLTFSSHPKRRHRQEVAAGLIEPDKRQQWTGTASGWVTK